MILDECRRVKSGKDIGGLVIRGYGVSLPGIVLLSKACMPPMRKCRKCLMMCFSKTCSAVDKCNESADRSRHVQSG